MTIEKLSKIRSGKVSVPATTIRTYGAGPLNQGYQRTSPAESSVTRSQVQNYAGANSDFSRTSKIGNDDFRQKPPANFAIVKHDTPFVPHFDEACLTEFVKGIVSQVADEGKDWVVKENWKTISDEELKGTKAGSPPPDFTHTKCFQAGHQFGVSFFQWLAGDPDITRKKIREAIRETSKEEWLRVYTSWRAGSPGLRPDKAAAASMQSE